MRFGRVNWMRVLLALFDLALINLGAWLAIWLRHDEGFFFPLLATFYRDAGWALLAAVGLFYLFGLHNRIWEHASNEAVLAISGAVTTSTALVAIGLLLRDSPAYHPATLASIWLVWVMLIGGSRFAWRLLRQRLYRMHSTAHPVRTRRVLIYGAGEAGGALARRIDHAPNPGLEVLGLVDDDSAKQGMLVRRYRVLGAGEDLARLAAKHRADEVIIAIPSASGTQVRQIVAHCQAAGLPCSRLPSRLEMMGVGVSLSQLRAVHLADLLSREPASLPFETCGAYLRNQVVLVTGAGGSIGSEICRQAARFGPRRLVLLGRGENRIHAIYQELRRSAPEVSTIPVIANFASDGVAEHVFRQHAPDVVFHAGAHKHVYLMEANVLEAVRNNVFGTRLVLTAARDVGVSRLVAISTDKAAEPASVMGATKRMCELLAHCTGGAGAPPSTVTVRFGNVLGTEGSVLRIFERQLREGHPLTITHPEASRYFMTCEEAALLVIEAGNPEHGAGIYLLDMGEPVTIQDLAAELVRLWGGDPDDPRNYEYVGLLPGEKLHEKLVNEWERLTRVTPYLLRIDDPGCPEEQDVDWALAKLGALAAEGNEDDLRRALFGLLRELRPQAASVESAAGRS